MHILAVEKDKARKHQDFLTSGVESFVRTIMSSKDHLETLQKSAYQLLRECHITDIIRQKKEKLQELYDAYHLSVDRSERQPVDFIFETVICFIGWYHLHYYL